MLTSSLRFGCSRDGLLLVLHEFSFGEVHVVEEDDFPFANSRAERWSELCSSFHDSSRSVVVPQLDEPQFRLRGHSLCSRPSLRRRLFCCRKGLTFHVSYGESISFNCSSINSWSNQLQLNMYILVATLFLNVSQEDGISTKNALLNTFFTLYKNNCYSFVTIKGKKFRVSTLILFLYASGKLCHV